MILCGADIILLAVDTKLLIGFTEYDLTDSIVTLAGLNCHICLVLSTSADEIVTIVSKDVLIPH